MDSGTQIWFRLPKMTRRRLTLCPGAGLVVTDPDVAVPFPDFSGPKMGPAVLPSREKKGAPEVVGNWRFDRRPKSPGLAATNHRCSKSLPEWRSIIRQGTRRDAALYVWLRAAPARPCRVWAWMVRGCCTRPRKQSTYRVTRSRRQGLCMTVWRKTAKWLGTSNTLTESHTKSPRTPKGLRSL